jgi:16S rRNA (uracil1498-N3)-methyltransferase
MHRFYLPPEQCQDTELVLTGREAHHALDVLRAQRGERVVVLDGAGHEFLCEIRERSRGEVRLVATQKNFIPPLPYRMTLLQAVPKGKTFELILQKATELGVSRIVPILSERVVTQFDQGEVPAKVEK